MILKDIWLGSTLGFFTDGDCSIVENQGNREKGAKSSKLIDAWIAVRPRYHFVVNSKKQLSTHMRVMFQAVTEDPKGRLNLEIIGVIKQILIKS